MRRDTGFIDLTGFLVKTHLGTSDRRIQAAVERRKADHKARLQLRAQILLGVLLERLKGFFHV